VALQIRKKLCGGTTAPADFAAGLQQHGLARKTQAIGYLN
jgi:hypothetical protein